MARFRNYNREDRMRMWARVGLAFIGGVLTIGGIQATRSKPEVSWKCEAKGDSGHCRVENKGGVSADVNFNVVVVCKDGEHLAHVSARVDPNSHVTKMIDSFEPSVGMLTSCAGIDYRTPIVKPST